MAVPALLTIGWIQALLVGMVAWLSEIITKKVAVMTIAIGAMAAVMLGLKTALQASIAAIAYSLPSGPIAAGIGMLPANTPACASAILAGHAAAWVARTQVVAIIQKFRAVV